MQISDWLLVIGIFTFFLVFEVAYAAYLRKLGVTRTASSFINWLMLAFGVILFALVFYLPTNRAFVLMLLRFSPVEMTVGAVVIMCIIALVFAIGSFSGTPSFLCLVLGAIIFAGSIALERSLSGLISIQHWHELRWFIYFSVVLGVGVFASALAVVLRTYRQNRELHHR